MFKTETKITIIKSCPCGCVAKKTYVDIFGFVAKTEIIRLVKRSFWYYFVIDFVGKDIYPTYSMYERWNEFKKDKYEDELVDWETGKPIM